MFLKRVQENCIVCRNCVLFWDRRNPIFFLRIRIFENLRVESTQLFVKRIVVSSFHRELVSRELKNFSVRVQANFLKSPESPRSRVLFSSTCKRDDVSHISKTCISIVKFLKAATLVCSAKHRFYTGELGICTHDRVHRLAREN